MRVNVIHTGVGGITENDVNLAAASNAMVVGFNVRPSAEARALAERAGDRDPPYRVIYQLTDEIEQALVGMLTPVETEAVIGEVEVRDLFRASRVGTIAGCMVTSGVVRRGANVRIFREGTRIHETTVAQLQRFKDDAREVTEGFECGILLEGFNDLREGDIFEVFETREVERTSLDEARRPPDLRGRRASLTAPASSRSSPSSSTSPRRLAQGQAPVRASAKDNSEPVRRVGRRGRPPRPLAATPH